DELQDIREVALMLLNDVCTIERSETIQEGLNERVVWNPYLTNIPCRVAEQDRAGDRENEIGGRLTSHGEYIVRLPYGTDIHESDRIRVRINRHERLLEVSRVLEHSYATTT